MTRSSFVEFSEKRLIKNLEKVKEGKNDTITKTRFLALIRENTDKADSNLSNCLSSNNSESDCYSDYGRELSNINMMIDSMRSHGKRKSFYLPCISSMLDDESKKIIEEINKKVEERTSYGRRKELAETNSIILSWSNSSKSWNPAGRAKKGEEVDLGANMILVKNIKDITKLGHISSCLQELPLYKLSFEAIYERKETPFVTGLATWMERKMQELKAKEDQEKNA